MFLKAKKRSKKHEMNFHKFSVFKHKMNFHKNFLFSSSTASAKPKNIKINT